MITLESLCVVEEEMARLQQRITELRNQCHQEVRRRGFPGSHLQPAEPLSNWAPRHTGAVRRSSMEVTRALADLRRPKR